MNVVTTEEITFNQLGISQRVLEVLSRLKFKTPTPIQHQSIPVGIEGKDIIGIAQTGTGKTLAFGIPVVERLQLIKGRALILLPTRELALQVNEALQKIAKPFGIFTAVLIGGESMNRQWEALRHQPRVLVATPGRLIDHLRQGSVRLDDIRILVLDEADRMLDMGFAPQINQILKTVPRERQTLLYSATMPSGIVQIAASYMALPVRVEVAPTGTVAEKVEQEIIFVHKEAKLALLETLLHECRGTVLVFSRTKHGARKICKSLHHLGHRAAEIHSNRSLNQRREALDGFKSGRYRVLVATDIAARGIDVSDIELVVNFDLPDNSEDYVHRIGRTGRAGKAGRAVSFATPDQRGEIRHIERLIRKTLKIIPMPPLVREAPKPSQGAAPQSERRTEQRRPERRTDQRPQQRPQDPGRQDYRRRSATTGQRDKPFGKPRPPSAPFANAPKDMWKGKKIRSW